jgi:hypothetical protein
MAPLAGAQNHRHLLVLLLDPEARPAPPPPEAPKPERKGTRK